MSIKINQRRKKTSGNAKKNRGHEINAFIEEKGDCLYLVT
jgi:hypothetical protein